MMKAIWAGNTPYSKFLITVGIILLSAVTFTLLSTMAVSVFFGTNMTEMQNLFNDLDSPRTIQILKVIQTISAIGTFIVPPFVLAYLFSNKPKEYLSFDRKTMPVTIMYVFLAMIAATPFINFLGELNSTMHLPASLKGVEDWMKESEERAALLTKEFLKMDSPLSLLFNIFMIGLIPAIGEELVFRGIVQKLFQQLTRNIHAGIWISAILFSAMHMQFYGFLPRMLLGVTLGYMLVWSGNLWLPIAGHFINNAGAVVLMYLYQHDYTSMDPDKIGTESDFASVIISIALTVFLLLMIRKRSLKNTSDNIIVN